MKRSVPSAPETSERFTIRVPRDMDGLAQLGNWVDTVAESLHLPNKDAFALRLCLEEATANLVMHGVPASASQPDVFDITLDDVGDGLRLAVEDRCVAFDPLNAAAPAPLVSLETARIGGLGIHLMKQYTRDLAYITDGGANRLVMTLNRG